MLALQAFERRDRTAVVSGEKEQVATEQRGHRVIAIPPAPRAPVRAMVAKAMVRRAAGRLPYRIVSAGGETIGATSAEGEPVLALRRPASFYRRLGASGLIGFGEGYQSGDWDSDNLAELLAVLVGGLDVIVPPPLQRVRGHSAARRRPREERQTVDGARSNARHHYALPVELFRAFLDETMCYSSAIFPVDARGGVIAEDSMLASAQVAKIDRLLDLAGVGDGTRVLEIGTGWGELPVRAAQRGAHVHTVTNMAEHAAYARERAAQAGVADKIQVDLRDYRELSTGPGSYDAIVSVEMIEAVGRPYWPVYFQVLGSQLAPGGRIALQCMTMRHDRMLRTSTTYTWSDKYIFPGGLLPSIPAIEQALAPAGLRIRDSYAFADHYRATLALWRDRFNRNWPAVAGLGFDDVFRRTWNFYLASSEAGFAANYLDVHQFLITV
jgi:cyclopropane-fatty-acyl-phospholipid synthase